MERLKKILLSRYFYLLLSVIFIFSRLATWLFPFDSDHWVFYYIGRRWVEGATLYIDMWDHKSPLIFAYNGLLHLLFGDNIVLHRAFFTLIALASVWLFFITARKLYRLLKLSQIELAARISTLIFVFLTNLSVFTNSGNNNENIGLIFLIGCLYAYLRYREAKFQNWLLLSGCLASFVFLFKANFAILLLPIIIDLIVINRKNIYRLVGSLAYLAFLPLLHLLFWVIYFNRTGTLKQFFIAAFEFNSKYMKALGWDFNSPGLVIFIGIIILLIAFFTPFLVQTLKEIRKKGTANNYLLGLLAGSSLLFILAAGTFYSHYFLIAIAYLSLVAGAVFLKSFGSWRRLKIILLSFSALTLLAASYKQLYNSFFGSVASDAESQAAVAKYVNQNTKNDDTIFAYTYGATMYRLADRNSGSRFISASHPLIDYKYQFGYDFNTTFIVDMVFSEAKYVIISNNPDDLYRRENPVLMRFIDNNYRLETTIDGYDILRRK